jgi:hypothetical protein
MENYKMYFAIKTICKNNLWESGFPYYCTRTAFFHRFWKVPGNFLSQFDTAGRIPNPVFQGPRSLAEVKVKPE